MIKNLDIGKVRERYAEERGRRLRADGMDQYNYGDPRVDPATQPVKRDPVFRETDAVVIGAGIGGLTAAARLRQAGLERITLIDRAGDVGGTWYWNRYPGAQCDIESYVYMPLLEEVGTMPTLKYAYQPEILAHLQRLAHHFGLYEDALFQSEVEFLRWDEQALVWEVRTHLGDQLRARYVVLAGGFFQRPKLPGIAGMNDFAGTLFHTSRWNYDYTGGEPGPDGGGLPGLADKRVGIVGTGATALQCVPPVAAAAGSVYVFQRTPTVVFERGNRPTDSAWAAGLQRGWQAERMAAFTGLTAGVPLKDDPVGDGWTQDFARVALAHGLGLFGGPDEQTQAELVDLATMQRVHERVDSIVESPETAESLKPRYRIMCKRPSFHDLYLQTFNRPNVHLVDTHGRGVDKMTRLGLIAEAVEYELDCVILATGFDTRPMLRQLALDPVGRDGRTLSEHWDPEMRTHHGFLSHGFPNLFLVGLTQTAAGINFGHTLREQADHIGYIVGEMRARGHSTVEATAEAEEAWAHAIVAAAPPTLREFSLACTPGYYNNEGGIDDEQRFGNGNYLAGPVVFFGLLRQWRDAGDLEGLQCS